MEKPSAFDGIQKKKVVGTACALLRRPVGCRRYLAAFFPQQSTSFFFRYSSLFFSSLFTQRVH